MPIRHNEPKHTLDDVVAAIIDDGRQTRETSRETSRGIVDLGRMFSAYFEDQRHSRLDELEREREAKAEKERREMERRADISRPEKTRDDGDGFGLGLLTAIGLSQFAFGAVEGVLQGIKAIVMGFSKTILLALKPLAPLVLKPAQAIYGVVRSSLYAALGLGVDGKPVVTTPKFVKDLTRGVSLVDVVSDGLRGFASSARSSLYAALGLGVDGKPVVTTGRIAKAFASASSALAAASAGLSSFADGASAGLGNLGSKAAAAARAVRESALGKIALGWVDDLKSLGKMIGGAGRAAARAVNVFRPIADLISRFVGVFDSILGGLRVLGRAIFLPLTVILSIVDFVKGAFEGWNDEEGEGGLLTKAISAGLGGISGLLEGLVGLPFDFVKGAIAWIAEKFGFDGTAEFLRSFSFTDMISNFFDSVTDFVTDAIDGAVKWYKDGGVDKFIDDVVRDFKIVGSVLATFAKAVGKGALAAIKALPPGGESPADAFSRVYGEIMSGGMAAIREEHGLALPEERGTNAATLERAIDERETMREEAAQANQTLAVSAPQVDARRYSNVNAPRVADPTPPLDLYDRVLAP